MKPAPLHYERPADLAAARALLGAHDGARVLAGGQSLVAALRLRELEVALLVDVTRLAELRGIALEPDAVVIGAAEPMLSVERSELVARHLPLLPRVLRTVGAVGVRSRATLGGSLAWSEPTSQLLAAMLALGVHAETDRRVLAGVDVPTGRNRTALEPGEVLVRLRFPRDVAGPGGLHVVRRTHLTWPTVGGVATRAGDGVRLGLFGVASRPVVVEGTLPGELVDAALAEVDPYDDERAPAAYRRRVAPVVARRALAELAA
jgi:aerobic carbon-monoxide dehydrogenase medium subunit